MENITILIIEDEPTINRIVSNYFMKEKFKVLSALDGFKGLQLFSKNKVDLVCLDIMMPNVNGWDVAKTAFPEIRTMLQSLGVGARKTFGDMFWVKQALNELQLFGEVNYVITDVRYPNEAKAIRDYDNSQIWRIRRSGVIPVNAHSSETAMDGEKVDQIFLNNGTLEDLAVLIGTRMRAYV